jgi:hypothetical protein
MCLCQVLLHPEHQTNINNIPQYTTLVGLLPQYDILGGAQKHRRHPHTMGDALGAVNCGGKHHSPLYTVFYCYVTDLMCALVAVLG